MTKVSPAKFLKRADGKRHPKKFLKKTNDEVKEQNSWKIDERAYGAKFWKAKNVEISR
jgi:hypothetical protein